MVHHIYFNIQLPRYNARCCSRQPKRRLPSVNMNFIVSDGIRKLFCILSSWKRVHDLTLEVGAYSPSDFEHCFKTLSSEDSEHDVDPMPDTRLSHYHDPRHGWIDGQQVQAPPRPALMRLFRLISLVSDDIPRVKAVTCCITSRQLRRRLSPNDWGFLLRIFERLEQLNYEPWTPYNINDTAFHYE
ncbi:hypothetical protein GGR53DRAFT_64101 [Hypoxylon sp. FL1150]|nr:hypothetical protein GGR53DRAFT_64101 [Hypoxylon sp. FL1150]